MFFHYFQLHPPSVFFFFFNDTATTEIYTLSLHDALPIWASAVSLPTFVAVKTKLPAAFNVAPITWSPRSEEHTSELQSRLHLVCRLLLEKKKIDIQILCKLQTKLNMKI